MTEDNINKEIPLLFYYYWDSTDFQHWVKEGYIPAELLEPSKVLELYEYIYKNRSKIFKKIPKRSKKRS